MPRAVPKTKAGKRAKVGKVMKEFHKGKLHSGDHKGPLVDDPDQAVAIAMRMAGMPKKGMMGKMVPKGETGAKAPKRRRKKARK